MKWQPIETAPKDGSSTQQTPEYNLMRTPEFTWQWCFNGRWDGIIVNVEKPVCWFHRVMQRLILGIHWRKIEETK